MINCQNVSKTIDGIEILTDISFKVDKFKTLGILGPNGAGKSTTFKILATLLKPTSGSIEVDGQDIYKSPSLVRNLIGYLPESLPLYSELTVFEYLKLFASLKGVARSKFKSEIDEKIKLCRLTTVVDKRCGVLSKGFRQKVGLATALIGNSKILILDEPTSGLDPKEIVEIRALIMSLKKSHTILFSSHVLSEVSELCDDVVIFIGGKTAKQTSLSNLESLEKTFLDALNGQSGRIDE